MKAEIRVCPDGGPVDQGNLGHMTVCAPQVDETPAASDVALKEIWYSRGIGRLDPGSRQRRDVCGKRLSLRGGKGDADRVCPHDRDGFVERCPLPSAKRPHSSVFWQCLG